MDTSGRGKTGNQRKTQLTRRSKKTGKAKKTGETGNTSEKKNFSSRNINKIIKDVKKEDQQRKNKLKYSAHNKRPKPNELFYRRTKNKRTTGDNQQQERVSAQAEIRRYLDESKKPKKRVKTTRMLTQEQGTARERNQEREKSADWLGQQVKNLENELSMSDNASRNSFKTPFIQEMVSKGAPKMDTFNHEKRKKGKFQMPGKKKSLSKLAYKQMKMQTKTDKAKRRKGQSKIRLVKTPQAKQKFLDKHLLQKNLGDSRHRIKTVAGSPLPESDGFKRLQKKGRLPKSTRNVAKAGQIFFANSTNNIPLFNDLKAERGDFKLNKPNRFSKKSKSKSNAGNLAELNLGKNPKKRVFKQKKQKLNNTYDIPNKTGRSLGFSKLSSNQRKTSRSPRELFPAKRVSSRQQMKNFSLAYEVKTGAEFNQKVEQPPKFAMKDSYSQFKNVENTDRPIFYKKPGFYHIKDLPKPKLVKYRESAGPRNELHSMDQPGKPEIYMTPSLDYKIYSEKNLENLPKTSIVQMNLAQGNWHSQRNSHPNMIELIRVPIQALEKYPMDEGQIYYQKSKTHGNSRPQSHLSSYGEFPSSPYSRYVPQQVGSKQYIGPREVPRNSKQYFEQNFGRSHFEGGPPGVEQDIYKFRDYQRPPIGYLRDNQQFVMVNKPSDDRPMWFKARFNENQEHGMSSPPLAKPPK